MKAESRSIEACMRDGLLSRAVALAKNKQAALICYGAATALRDLFPTGALFERDRVTSGVDADFRIRLEAAAAKAISRFPRRSGPGPNGSRFEHWGTLAADNGSLQAGAKVVVSFLLGELPDECMDANLGARLLAARKPNGGVRPLACGSVIRRLAAKAACAVHKEELKQACGPDQYGVGRKAGCEVVHKCITAMTDEDDSRVVLAFDCTNAFNILPRTRVRDAVRSRAPGLSPTVEA